MRIRFQPGLPQLVKDDRHDRGSWQTFACPETWCRTEVRMRVEPDTMVATGTAFLECPRCLGGMRIKKTAGLV